jgi:hypothetical protein
MPRRRRATPPSPLPVQAPDSEPPEDVEVVDARGRQSGGPELIARRKVVRHLVALGVTRHQLTDAMVDQGWIVSEHQAKRDYDAILREWSADGEADKAHTRAAQIARLTSDLVRLRRDAATTSTSKGPAHAARVGYWRAVEAHEALLARIQGHFAPVKVTVDASLTVRASLVAVIAGMTAEELDALAAEQRVLEAEAAEARRLR